MRRTLLLLVATALSSAVHAANWQPVSSGDDIRVQVDVASIVREGRYVKAWSTWDYAAQQDSRPGEYPAYKFFSYKQLTYYDCGAKSIAIAQTHYYTGMAGSGAIAQSYTRKVKAQDFAEVIPDSYGDTLLLYVCLRAPGKAAVKWKAM